MVKINEVKEYQKHYDKVITAGQSKHKYLRQKLFQVADDNSITIDELRVIMNRASKNAPDKNYSIVVLYNT